LVRDSKYFSFTEMSRPHFYLPFRQSYQLGQHIVFFVRAKGDPDAAISTMRREAVALDPNASSFTAAPLTEYNALLLLPLKLAANLLAALGVIAFLLAGVGLYGVMSYSVSQRTHELGIRMALGAKPREVLGIVVRQGMLLTGGGVVIGLALALASMRLLASLLVDVSPFDPLTFLAASLFLAAVAAVACSLPAHRATRIDPFTALRSD
jgi:ABC-type antimicrobial peptide transport system permease subunit